MMKKTMKALMLILCVLFFEPEAQSQTASEASRYDVIISEIMAKPSPGVGLPPVEYVELHNRLPRPCKLRNWRLTLGNTTKNLPEITLDSCGYVVLIAQKFAEEFAPYCDQVATLSSLAVTDGGQALTLLDERGEVIHHVCFKSTWHAERIKQDGGWSLEMIDAAWPCAGPWNWGSSTDPLGGTPGRPNSIRCALEDNNIPCISGVTMLDTCTLRVHFSKTLDFPEGEVALRLQTDPSLEITSASEVPPEFASIDIRFGKAPLNGKTYTLQLAGELPDCGTNVFHVETSTAFGIAAKPTYNSMVINEILTNPMDGEAGDYLEIFNRSDQIVDLKDVKIGYGGDTLPQKAVTAFPKGRQLPPLRYAVLCRDRTATMQQYYCKDASSLIPCDSLPDFAIGHGIIHLTDKSLRCIDRFEYMEEMHYPKLLTTKGVALERLYANHPTQDENNWRSAAESAGFGTPGYENSQQGNALPRDEIHVEPEVFSPDNDGFQDFSEFIFRFNDTENRVNIILLNHYGAPVKHLVNNVLCGTEANFRWDGDNDDGHPLPAGMYVADIDYWNLRSKSRSRTRKVVSIYR